MLVCKREEREHEEAWWRLISHPKTRQLLHYKRDHQQLSGLHSPPRIFERGARPVWLELESAENARSGAMIAQKVHLSTLSVGSLIATFRSRKSIASATTPRDAVIPQRKLHKRVISQRQRGTAALAERSASITSPRRDEENVDRKIRAFNVHILGGNSFA